MNELYLEDIAKLALHLYCRGGSEDLIVGLLYDARSRLHTFLRPVAPNSRPADANTRISKLVELSKLNSHLENRLRTFEGCTKQSGSALHLTCTPCGVLIETEKEQFITHFLNDILFDAADRICRLEIILYLIDKDYFL